MISESEEKLLDKCLSKVHHTSNIGNIVFTQEDIQEFIQDCGLSDDDFERNWKAFFLQKKKPTEEGDTETVYYLNCSKIVEEWVNEIKSRDWFFDVGYKKVDERVWQMNASSGSRGVTEFLLFFHGERASEFDPNSIKGRVGVHFVDSETSKEFLFYWRETLEEEFWNQLRDSLAKAQDPRGAEVYDLSSPAAKDNREGIHKGIKYYLKKQELEYIEEPERHIPSIEEYLEGPFLFAGKEDKNSYLVMCECDKIADTGHVHYFVDGKPTYVTESDYFEDIIEAIREDIRYYQEILQKKENVLPIIKISGAIGAILAGQVTVPLVWEGLGYSLPEGTRSEVFNISAIVATLLMVLIIIYMILPIIQFRRFSWGKPSYWDKLKNR